MNTFYTRYREAQETEKWVTKFVEEFQIEKSYLHKDYFFDFTLHLHVAMTLYPEDEQTSATTHFELYKTSFISDVLCTDCNGKPIGVNIQMLQCLCEKAVEQYGQDSSDLGELFDDE